MMKSRRSIPSVASRDLASWDRNPHRAIVIVYHGGRHRGVRNLTPGESPEVLLRILETSAHAPASEQKTAAPDKLLDVVVAWAALVPPEARLDRDWLLRVISHPRSLRARARRYREDITWHCPAEDSDQTLKNGLAHHRSTLVPLTNMTATIGLFSV